MARKEHYDVIIVGGGISGLTAAYHLRNYNSILLEKEPRLGGRILTRYYKGESYDLGAIIGYDPDKIPIKVNSSLLIREDDNIGLVLDDRIYTGFDIKECICKALDDNSLVLNEIEDFQNGRLSLQSLSPLAHKIIYAAFKVIHPGEINCYSSRAYSDVFRKYYPSHFLNGNSELIRQYELLINSEIKCNTAVKSVKKNHEYVNVSYNTSANGTEEIKAKVAIIATTANVALHIISEINDTCKKFLSSIRYSPYLIAALFLKDRRLLNDISYVITPDLSMDMIFERKITSDRMSQLIIYFGENAMNNINVNNQKKILQNILSDLNRISYKPITASDILFHDFYKWDIGGTNIYDADKMQNEDLIFRATDSIILAGDYLYSVYPYGMKAATRSGLSASKLAMKYLTC